MASVNPQGGTEHRSDDAIARTSSRLSAQQSPYLAGVGSQFTTRSHPDSRHEAGDGNPAAGSTHDLHTQPHPTSGYRDHQESPPGSGQTCCCGDCFDMDLHQLREGRE